MLHPTENTSDWSFLRWLGKISAFKSQRCTCRAAETPFFGGGCGRGGIWVFWSVILKELHNPFMKRRGGCLAPDLLVPKINHKHVFVLLCDETSQREEAAEQSRLPSGSCANLPRRSRFTFWQSGMSSATWRRKPTWTMPPACAWHKLCGTCCCLQRGVDQSSF